MVAIAEPGHPQTMPPDPTLIAIDQVRAEADALSAYATLNGFGAVVQDQDARTVALYWRGEVPSAVSERAGMTDEGVTVTVRNAAYTDAQLHAASSAVVTAGKSLPHPVIEAGPRPDASGITVSLDASSLEEVDDGDLRLIQRVAGTVPTAFLVGDPIQF